MNKILSSKGKKKISYSITLNTPAGMKTPRSLKNPFEYQKLLLAPLSQEKTCK